VGVLLRDQRVGQAASERLSAARSIPPGDFARELRRLKRAELLNPGSKWDLARARYLFARGRPRQAAHVAEALVRQEPENVEGWVLLSLATERFDRVRSLQALAQVFRLSPLKPAPRG
jgi:predicted Zn-dependent protease